MKAPKKLYDAMQANNGRFGEYICHVKEIKVMKTGSARLVLAFSGSTHILYTRDKKIKTEVSKNDIETFKIIPRTYVGRDGYLKGVLNLELVSQD
jgi:hypothetical protein